MLALGPAMCCSGQPTAAGGCCPAPCRPGNVCGSHNPPPHGPAHLRRTRLLLSCRECCCCCCVDMAGLPHRHTALNCCPAPPRPADGSPLEMAGLSHAQSSVCRPLSSPVCSLPHQHCRRLPAGDGAHPIICISSPVISCVFPAPLTLQTAPRWRRRACRSGSWARVAGRRGWAARGWARAWCRTWWRTC